jgi:hypothetical protein
MVVIQPTCSAASRARLGLSFTQPCYILVIEFLRVFPLIIHYRRTCVSRYESLTETTRLLERESSRVDYLSQARLYVQIVSHLLKFSNLGVDSQFQPCYLAFDPSRASSQRSLRSHCNNHTPFTAHSLDTTDGSVEFLPSFTPAWQTL